MSTTYLSARPHAHACLLCLLDTCEHGVSASSREALQSTSSKPPAIDSTVADASSKATETRGGHETGEGSSRDGSGGYEPSGDTGISTTFAYDGGSSGSVGGGGGTGGGTSLSSANSRGVRGHGGQQGRPGEGAGAACSGMDSISPGVVARVEERQSQRQECVFDAETGERKGRVRSEDVLLRAAVGMGKVTAGSGEAWGRSRSGRSSHLHDRRYGCEHKLTSDSSSID